MTSSSSMDWTRLFCCAISCLVPFLATTRSSFIALNKRDVSCRENFTDVNSGNFASHTDLDSKYPTNRRCGWLMESSAQEALIVISFLYFEVAKNPRCDRYDIVEVFKRDYGETDWETISPREGYCGQIEPFDVAAKTQSLYVTFKSDHIQKDNERGFNVSFIIKRTRVKPEVAGIGRVDDGMINNFTSTIIVVQEDMLTVQCYKRGNPNPSVNWMKVLSNGTELPIRAGLIKTVISNGSIQLHDVQISDEGKYLCSATNKISSANATFQLVVKEKCLCPKKITVFWFKYPPYTRYRTNFCKDTVKRGCYTGILYNLLNDMIAQVCGNCVKGHNETVIDWNEIGNQHKTLTDLKRQIIDGTYDIYLPVEGGKDDTKYRLSYEFIPIVESPGTAFMVVKEKEGSASQAVVNSILDGWPILVLTIVMAFLSGIIIWMLDTYWNEEQFPRSLREGIAEGFWWAFVSMTTVGYGDIAPLGVPGRIFAIMWILTGLVIIAIFTSVITTSLTVVTMSTDKKLYGSVVGAISESSEYRLGVIKNAEMKGYLSFNGLYKDMNVKKINGCLIDAYVAAHYSKEFQQFRVNNIFASNKAYGIVLGKRLQYLHPNFSEWVDSHKHEITKSIKGSTKTLKKPSGSAAMDKSAELFDPNSQIFEDSIFGTTIILVILTIGGLIFEYGYLRPRHRMIEAAKNLEMMESTEVKEMAKRTSKLKEILLSQVSEFSERWNERLSKLKLKHKEEQKYFISQGKGKKSTPRLSSAVRPALESPASGDDMVGMDGLDGDTADTVDQPDGSPDYRTTVGL